MSKQLLTEKDIKSAEAVLAKGYRVELIPVKDGVRVIRVRRDEVLEKEVQNHNCRIDCSSFEKCKRDYLNGNVNKCLYFGNKKDFGDLK